MFHGKKMATLSGSAGDASNLFALIPEEMTLLELDQALMRCKEKLAFCGLDKPSSYYQSELADLLRAEGVELIPKAKDAVCSGVRWDDPLEIPPQDPTERRRAACDCCREKLADVKTYRGFGDGKVFLCSACASLDDVAYGLKVRGLKTDNVKYRYDVDSDSQLLNKNMSRTVCGDLSVSISLQTEIPEILQSDGRHGDIALWLVRNLAELGPYFKVTLELGRNLEKTTEKSPAASTDEAAFGL